MRFKIQLSKVLPRQFVAKLKNHKMLLSELRIPAD